jgi:predicted acetyltransferase
MLSLPRFFDPAAPGNIVAVGATHQGKQSLSPVFRDGEKTDVPAVARLLQHSFPGAYPTAAEWEAILVDSPRGGAETLWVGEEGGEIVAACRLYRLQQWVGGVTLPVMGLGAVSISAVARRRGIAHALVASALRRARQRGDVATALYPFRTRFYQKLGYGMAGEALQFTVPPSSLRDHPARERVRLVETDEDRQDVAEVYEDWAANGTGQLLRSDRAWDLVWQDGTRHGALYLNDHGEPEGYVVFRYPADRAGAPRAVEVEEIAWLHDEARRGLHAWLGSLSDQWDQVVYRAHPDEGFQEQLTELRHPIQGSSRWHFWFPVATQLQGPMFRLLHLEEAWRSRTIRRGARFVLRLRVEDEDVPGNSGEWTLDLAGESARISRASRGPADLTLEVGIETLSRIFIGAVTPSAAVVSGAARADRPDRLVELDLLLRIPRPWMFDRF